MSQPPESRGRDRRNLKDLAKLASSASLTPTPPPSKAVSVSPMATTRRSDPGDSGIVDLKMMAQFDPEAAERAKDTKLASAELFGDEPADSVDPPATAKAQAAPPSSGKGVAAPPASSSGAAARSAATVSSRTGAAASAQAAPKTDEGKTSTVVWIAGVTCVFAAAAAAVIMLQSSGSAPTADSTPPPAPVAATAKAAPKSAPPPAEPVAVADPAPAKDPNEVDPSTLPKAANGARTTAAPGKAVAGGPKKTVIVQGASAPAVDTPNPVKPELVANVPMSPTENGALDKALRQAAGPSDNPSGGSATPSTSPQFDPGSVPQKPSAGAIAGGVSAAMSQARSCIGLDDPISRAAVTFDSSGAVKDVVVSGYAAGKPAEACIKAALSKAKVPPFAQPIYTQTFTVRPNS
jgi:hypothetical protein